LRRDRRDPVVVVRVARGCSIERLQIERADRLARNDHVIGIGIINDRSRPRGRLLFSDFSSAGLEVGFLTEAEGRVAEAAQRLLLK